MVSVRQKLKQVKNSTKSVACVPMEIPTFSRSFSASYAIKMKILMAEIKPYLVIKPG